jgi:hypothetical protein
VIEACFLGHDDVVTGICAFPDGLRIASCSHDGKLKVWKIAQHAGSTPSTKHREIAPAPAPTSAPPSGMQLSQPQHHPFLQHLQSKVDSTESMNEILRGELSKAQDEIQEKNLRMWRREESLGAQEQKLNTQEQKLNDYRHLVDSLAAGKEEQQKLHEAAMQRMNQAFTPAPAPRSILEQLPTSPAGSNFGRTMGVGSPLRTIGSSVARTGAIGSPVRSKPLIDIMAGSPGADSVLAAFGLGPAGAGEPTVASASPPADPAASKLLASIAGLGTAGASRNSWQPASGKHTKPPMESAGRQAESRMVASMCSNCGSLLTGDSAFCIRCGKKRTTDVRSTNQGISGNGTHVRGAIPRAGDPRSVEAQVGGLGTPYPLSGGRPWTHFPKQPAELDS